MWRTRERVQFRLLTKLLMVEEQVAVKCPLMYLATVTFILHLWQSFLALHPWGYVIAAALALSALMKRKAIGAGTSAVWKKFDAWFWEKMRTKLQLQPQTSQAGPTQLKTYSGTFQ